MKIHEYIAKDVFKGEGIPVPNNKMVTNPEDARKAAIEINKPVAIKSQVLVGGRGKAGGIKFAEIPDDVYDKTKEILGSIIKDELVEMVLIEEKIEILSEYYLSVVLDRSAKKPLIMASMSGGVDIEEVASETPEKIVKYYVNPLNEFLPYQGREIAIKMGVPNPLISKIGMVIWKLLNVFQKYDATIAEINPLVVTANGVIAADAKLDIDDDALYRQKELFELENITKDEFAYVKLDGNIAVIGNGAGLTLSGMDMLKLYGGEPATFLDIGGGSSRENIAKALNIVISDPDVKTVFLNVLGGITRADDVARGVLDVLNTSKRKVPLVIRLTGTNEEEGQKILKEAGVSYETSMEAAAKKAVELCKDIK
ncbi:ADP-forming succinate--CoA ligase subunit beta [Methanobacterium sp. SMA-27]|uniref:ADP-forming succinate--CoA ligase subunit beta n=1 Tax=Methanobacterium sp. SMA-27 TaxID=1495336 RepID=UPI00064EB450|nr:ADP-forming succinate--CoA ligase subunit beta [Methanobacterium sp. SMA-27]